MSLPSGRSEDDATTSVGGDARRQVAGISLVTATAIVVANMVGTGIFTSLGFQVGDLPSGFVLMLLWVLGGVCAFCGALSYGELAAALPRSGGEYHFLSVIFPRAVGFLSGWLSATVGFAAPIALAAMALGSYSTGVVPGVNPLMVSISVVVVVTLVHLQGTGAGSVLQNLATWLKVGLILVFIGAGFLMTNEVQPVTFLPVEGDWDLITSAPFAVSLVYVMYAYSGWNASTYIVGEVRDAARNVPLSVAIGTLLVGALYVLLNMVFLRVAPMSAMAGQIDVGHVAATHLFGDRGGRIMAGLICLGLISTVSAMTWIGPRVTMVMGEDYRMLGFLARKNGRGVPGVAMLVQMLIVTALLVTAKFDAVLTYAQFGLTLGSFLAVLGVLVLRKTQPNLSRPVRVWAYPLTPVLFLVINGWMLVHILIQRPMESLAGLGTVAAGLVVYWISPKNEERSE